MPLSPHPDKALLLQAALTHVPFDGWSEPCFKAAAADIAMPIDQARALCPRGAVDLAIAHHKEGDRRMRQELDHTDLAQLRFSERITHAVRLRIEAAQDKEILRRGSTLFALPQYAPDGAALIWATCDDIWRHLGDQSTDFNWYTKRATLAAVYSATLLFWLGDASEDGADTWAFLDRRIADVMQIEKAKAKFRQSPKLMRLFSAPAKLVGQIRAPAPPNDLPGRWG